LGFAPGTLTSTGGIWQFELAARIPSFDRIINSFDRINNDRYLSDVD